MIKMNIWFVLLLGFFVLVGFFMFYWWFTIINEQKKLIKLNAENKLKNDVNPNEIKYEIIDNKGQNGN